MLYLFMWLITSIASLGWIVLPGVLASAWALLGIEAAAVECSTPFRRQPNHLLLGEASIIIADGMSHSLSDAQARSHWVRRAVAVEADTTRHTPSETEKPAELRH